MTGIVEGRECGGRMMRDRKLNRLKDYDYAKEGFYFVTVCVKDKGEWFGEIKDGGMILNPYGEIVSQCWEDLQNVMDYPRLFVDSKHFHLAGSMNV